MSNLVYLISSLPSLTFGQTPPISLEKFHDEAKEQLSSKQFKKLYELELININGAKTNKIKSFLEDMEQLSADLFEIRNSKKNDRNIDLNVLPKSVLEQNPLEREKSIMNWQWDQLTNLESGEMFSMIQVYVYKLKLQIILRMDSFNTEKGKEILELVVEPPEKMEEV